MNHDALARARLGLLLPADGVLALLDGPLGPFRLAVVLARRYDEAMDIKRLLQNRTPMVVSCAVLDDRHGREQVVLFAKLTWLVSPDGEVTIAAKQSPIRPLGETQPEPATSLRFAAEMYDEVPGTDVILVGTAYPAKPRDTAVDVVLEVADSNVRRLRKVVRVYGPRVWQQSLVGVSVSAPAEMAPTPLHYENSWGGRDERDEEHSLVEPRNPVGLGIAYDRGRLQGKVAPAIEDPNHPLSSRKPAPAGFAPISADWSPRADRVGSYDERWRRERAPVRPSDFDPRANNAVPDDQHCEEPLNGDEMFGITGVLPTGKRWQFRLPQYRPSFFAQLRSDRHRGELQTHLDTVTIDADEQRVELLWRASTPLPPVPQMLELLLVGSRDRLPDVISQQILAIAREASRA